MEYRTDNYDEIGTEAYDRAPDTNYDVSRADTYDRPSDADSDGRSDSTAGEVEDGREYPIVRDDIPETRKNEADDGYERVPEDSDVLATIEAGEDDPESTEYFHDTEEMRELTEPFKPEIWEGLDASERRAALIRFQEFNNDLLGVVPSPDIEFYNNPQEGDYGGYSPSDNSLHINEYMLYDAEEALDTIAHETRHAYQHMRADNPQNERDFAFAQNFDDYIKPDDDFEAYQDQLVETDARMYAQRYKDYLATI